MYTALNYKVSLHILEKNYLEVEISPHRFLLLREKHTLRRFCNQDFIFSLWYLRQPLFPYLRGFSKNSKERTIISSSSYSPSNRNNDGDVILTARPKLSCKIIPSFDIPRLVVSRWEKNTRVENKPNRKNRHFFIHSKEKDF